MQFSQMKSHKGSGKPILIVQKLTPLFHMLASNKILSNILFLTHFLFKKSLKGFFFPHSLAHFCLYELEKY